MVSFVGGGGACVHMFMWGPKVSFECHSLDKAGCPASDPQRSACDYFSSAGMTSAHHHTQLWGWGPGTPVPWWDVEVRGSLASQFSPPFVCALRSNSGGKHLVFRIKPRASPASQPSLALLVKAIFSIIVSVHIQVLAKVKWMTLIMKKTSCHPVPCWARTMLCVHLR